MSFGRVLVFYPRYEATSCEIALVLDLDPLRLAGRGERVGLPLYPYVNDRPHVASSFLSVALSEVFRSALNGQCYVSCSLVATVTLKELLTHLYVLIPVLDDEKHYWIDEAEVEKLRLSTLG